jgi:hypothetical protein
VGSRPNRSICQASLRVLSRLKAQQVHDQDHFRRGQAHAAFGAVWRNANDFLRPRLVRILLQKSKIERPEISRKVIFRAL